MNKFIKVLSIMLVICIAVTSVYATITVPKGTDIKDDNRAATNVTGTAKNIWSTVVTIVQILAVAAVVFAGLRYMFASADQKADIKKSMGILAIGAVLVFGATLIIQLVGSATTSVLNNTK